MGGHDWLSGQLQAWLRPVWPQACWQPKHEAVAAEFVAGEAQCLFAWVEAGGQLCLDTAAPEQAAGKVLFALKESPPGATAATAAGGPSAGLIHGWLDAADVLGSLLQLMSQLYAPALLAASREWPDTLRQDFTGHVHKYVGALTEAVHTQQGRTVLYVPHEDTADGSFVAGGRELVQRLESCLLHWTEQISALLNRRANDELRLEEGPLAEIEFWTSRAADLGGIRAQLEGDAALKRMLKILEQAKSSYLPTFLSLGESISQEAAEAESNVRFLSSVLGPCTKLAQADLAAVPALLPGILDLLRMIWTLSPHYNSIDRIASLLRKLSNEVLNRCRAHIDLPALFSGARLDAVERALQLSIDITAQWKEAYAAAAARVDAAGSEGRRWGAISGTAFAHVDAFVQRCRDLQDMCAAHRQFAADARLNAVLGGPRAPEISKALAEVQAAFARLMGRFQALPYDALDVKNSSWYEDMAAFRSVTRDLELMLGNIVDTAYNVAATLYLKLEVLEAFYRSATRDGLRKCIETKMSEWHVHFISELNQVQELFESVKVKLPASAPLPQHAGQALLMKGLLRRIQHTWDSLQGSQAFLPAVLKAAESSAAYEAMHAGLQQYINTLNTTWYRSIKPDITNALNESLLRQDKATGLLAVNMDEGLAGMLEEAYLFDRLRLGVPGVASELLVERHRLLAERGGVVQVVRQYNLLQALSKDERRLFKDRIRYLDRRVLPGVNKLHWSTPKHQVAYFQREASKFCKETEAAVLELKAAGAAVAQACAAIRGTLLLNVERKRLYDLADFDTRQAQHQEAARAKLLDEHGRIRAALVPLYRFVSRDSEEVQQEWLRFLQNVDSQVLDAMTACVRRSLHEIVRCLNGDKKGTEVPPVFILSVILETNNRVELKPTLQSLFDTISGVCKRAVGLLEGIPRVVQDVIAGCSSTYGVLPSLLTGAPAAPPFVELVSKSDEAVLKQMQAITTGITGIVEKVQQFLVYWEKKFRQTYEQDKDMYMKRYERAGKSVAAFEVDIQKFRDLMEEVLAEEAATSMRFLRLDCAPLKQMLVAHCEAWVAKFLGLLHSLATRQLAALHATLLEHTAALHSAREQPDGPEALRGKLQAERAEVQGRIAQCKEKFAALEKLQVSVPDEELEKLQSLPRLWGEVESALAHLNG